MSKERELENDISSISQSNAPAVYSTPKFEFSWPLGDIVTALAQAGLRIQGLEEFPAEQSWRFREDIDQLHRLPGSFLLVASKDR